MYQRDLSVAYVEVGNVLVAQGDLAAALQAYRDSLGIRERLAKADPGNAGWQRDLSVSYDSSPHGVAGFLSRSALTDGLFSRGSSHSHWLRRGGARL
jgi:hypothetical protein